MNKIRKIYPPKDKDGKEVPMSQLHPYITEDYILADDKSMVKAFMIDTATTKKDRQAIKSFTHEGRLSLLKRIGFRIVEELSV